MSGWFWLVTKQLVNAVLDTYILRLRISTREESNLCIPINDENVGIVRLPVFDQAFEYCL